MKTLKPHQIAEKIKQGECFIRIAESEMFRYANDPSTHNKVRLYSMKQEVSGNWAGVITLVDTVTGENVYTKEIRETTPKIAYIWLTKN